MLVLSRKEGERISIGPDIQVVIVRLSNGKVRIGVEAPDNMPVHRRELYEKLMRENPGDVVQSLAKDRGNDECDSGRDCGQESASELDLSSPANPDNKTL